MPLLHLPAAGKKRKRKDEPISSTTATRLSKASKPSIKLNESRAEEILAIENEVIDSRKHYNSIANLLSIARTYKEQPKNANLAVIALCRVFCRLRARGDLEKGKHYSEAETVMVKWLEERQNDFLSVLAVQLRGKNKNAQVTALRLWMQLVKEEVGSKESAWTKGSFAKLIPILLLEYDATEVARDNFIQEYLHKFRDVQFYTLELIKESAPSSCSKDAISSCLDILFELPEVGSSEESTEFYASRPEVEKSRPSQTNALKKRAQEAWLCILRSNLEPEQVKGILSNLVHDILPWFNNVERLADFLTDAYNTGGSTSLLALSGVFHLIQERNLDYPSFYQKLYSLLDDGILHSKYRSRFFRLLNIFMSSTHLPAALVASFIKRLSRLALSAPPAAIVAVVPWIYNMFKRHPQCTFMIHRVTATLEEKNDITEHGFDDPFDMEESDPMQTNAIDSSIWEIETLQSHYHPNVAMLAKIISEQFTKQSYNLDDFLDYSYATLIDAELEKGMKKVPVIEYQIPKKVFTTEEDGLNNLGELMTDASWSPAE